jgi:hypothetical protein
LVRRSEINQRMGNQLPGFSGLLFLGIAEN